MRYSGCMRCALGLILAMGVACFDPKPKAGTPCDPDVGCPDSLECVDNVCVDPSAPGIDADITPPPIDAAPPDAKPPCVEGDLRVEDPATGVCYWALYSVLQEKAPAALACEAAGGHLVVISSAAESMAVTNVVTRALTDSGGLVPDYWIGANDTATEGTFVWENGEAFVYTNWRQVPLEPNNGQGVYEEDCVAAEADSPDPGQWDDRPCAANGVAPDPNLGYICER